MTKLTALLLYISTTVAYTQEIQQVFMDTMKSTSSIQISSQNYHASNGFNNAFTNKFIFGGEVTNELKDRTQEKLGQVNSFGAESNQSIDYYQRSVKMFGGKYGFFAGISDNHIVSSNVATDLYNIAMYGNAPYLEDSMDFSFSHFQYLHYQKFGFGFFNNETMSSIRLNFVAGSKTLQGRLTNAGFYSDLEQVSLALQGNGFRTQNFSPYFGFQGSGFAVDINYNFKLATKKFGDQLINLQVNNLGVIFWNRASTNYTVDSTVVYKGFDIQDFINSEEGAPTKEYNFEDTLGIQQFEGNDRTGIPIEFILQKLPQRNSDRKLQSIFGVKTIITSDYFPYFYAGLYYSPSKSFAATTRLSYGGFGGLQWGLNLNFWAGDRVYIGIGTFDMIGNISSEFGYGRSANLSACFNF